MFERGLIKFSSMAFPSFFKELIFTGKFIEIIKTILSKLFEFLGKVKNFDFLSKNLLFFKKLWNMFIYNIKFPRATVTCFFL